VVLIRCLGSKRAEVTPRLYIYGIIMFMLMVSGGVFILGSFASVNPDFVNNEAFAGFNRSFNRVSDVNTASAGLRSSIEGSSEEWGLFGVLNALIKSVWGAIKNIFSSFDFMLVALGGMSSVFGVPSWIVGLLTSLIVVMLAFSIYSLVFQGKS